MSSLTTRQTRSSTKKVSGTPKPSPPKPTALPLPTRQTRSMTRKSLGISKPTPNPTRTPSKNTPKLSKYFYHTNPTTSSRTLITSPTTTPLQSNTYTLRPSLFRSCPYPNTFPPSLPWPPRTPLALLRAADTAHTPCLGRSTFTPTLCHSSSCTHSLLTWPRTWEQHFSLRLTQDRGVGVFALHAMEKGAVLGWYAGEIVPRSHASPGKGYLMEMPIGRMSSSFEQQTVLIDAEKRGNWTRFINHSCVAHAVFCVARVGDVRVMGVVLERGIRGGEELTVGYGEGYYSVGGERVCRCGVRGCVSEKRR